MRYIFTCSIFIVLLSSCSTYQYVTLSSPDISKNDRHEFVAENDTMKLVYDFHGGNGPVRITAYNKLDRPLLLDLNRSVLIINNKAIGLNTGKIEVEGSISTSVNTTGGFSTASASGSVGAATVLPQGQMFIPGGTFISYTATVSLADRTFDNIPAGAFNAETVTTDDSFAHGLKTAHFAAGESPLAFRTMLTFMQPGSDIKESVWQNSFYVSAVVQTAARPEKMGYDTGPNGDRFYVSKTRKGAVVVSGIVLLTIFTVFTLAADHAAHP